MNPTVESGMPNLTMQCSLSVEPDNGKGYMTIETPCPDSSFYQDEAKLNAFTKALLCEHLSNLAMQFSKLQNVIYVPDLADVQVQASTTSHTIRIFVAITTVLVKFNAAKEGKSAGTGTVVLDSAAGDQTHRAASKVARALEALQESGDL